MLLVIFIVTIYIWLVYKLRDKMSTKNIKAILVYNVCLIVKIIVLSIFFWKTTDQGQAYIEIPSDSKWIIHDFEIIYKIRDETYILDFIFVMT